MKMEQLVLIKGSRLNHTKSAPFSFDYLNKHQVVIKSIACQAGYKE
jgi:hypothetical protein